MGVVNIQREDSLFNVKLAVGSRFSKNNDTVFSEWDISLLNWSVGFVENGVV